MEVNKFKLYYHKTAGGAEYLCMSKVEGTKDEGDLTTAILRIDGGEYEWLKEDKIVRPKMMYSFGVKATEAHDEEMETIEAFSLAEAKREFALMHPEDVDNIDWITSELGYEELQ